MNSNGLINFTAIGGWAAGVSLAASTVAKLIGQGENTVSALYSGNPGSYGYGGDCAGGVVAKQLTAPGGNPNLLGSPCYQGSDGNYYEDP